MNGGLTELQIEDFQRDGVICVRNAIDESWISRLLDFADGQMQTPSPWANNASPENKTNRLFTDRYLWKTHSEIKSFVFESACAELAAQALQSNQVRFYFDHLLIKEPQTPAPTPWHQDIPYWPFQGKQIASVWVALTDTTVEESAMEFVRGSHLTNKYFMPELFGTRDNHPSAWITDGQGERVPQIEEDRNSYDIVGWNVKAGDALIFSAWILHWAPGNSSNTKRRVAISTRWLGDDAAWFPHEGADPTVKQDDVRCAAGSPPADDDVFPVGWCQTQPT